MTRESQHTEWKAAWHDDHLRWVCGFANAEGGRLKIGRNDQGAIVGLADAAKLLEDLPNKIRDVLWLEFSFSSYCSASIGASEYRPTPEVTGEVERLVNAVNDQAIRLPKKQTLLALRGQANFGIAPPARPNRGSHRKDHSRQAQQPPAEVSTATGRNLITPRYSP